MKHSKNALEKKTVTLHRPETTQSCYKLHHPGEMTLNNVLNLPVALRKSTNLPNKLDISQILLTQGQCSAA